VVAYVEHLGLNKKDNSMYSNKHSFEEDGERGDGMILYTCSKCGESNIGSWLSAYCPGTVKERQEHRQRLAGGYMP